MNIHRLLLNQPHFPNLGLLFSRIITGGLMCYLHGWSKLMAGTGRWERLGSGLSDFLGLDFLSIPLGFMASFAESIAALLIIVGWYTRPSAFLLAFTMLVAVSKKIPAGLRDAELPLLFLCLSLLLLFSGAGKYSIDHLISKK